MITRPGTTRIAGTVVAEENQAVGHRLDLLTLIDQLQDLVESSPRIPFSDRIFTSSDALLDVLDMVKNTLPHDVIEAERVLQERHRLIEDAREEAEKLLENAREQSKFMVQEHSVVKAAEIRAERVVNQAHREADHLRASAQEYVQQLFTRFEDEAARISAEIRKASAAQRE